jgi:hypothetical protein
MDANVEGGGTMVRTHSWWLAAVFAAWLLAPVLAHSGPDPERKIFKKELLTGCVRPSYSCCHIWAPQLYRLCHATFGKAGYIYPKDLVPEIPLPANKSITYPCPSVDPAIMAVDHYYRPGSERPTTDDTSAPKEEGDKSAGNSTPKEGAAKTGSTPPER